jgi:phosphate transport system substrate-binding protein
MSTPPTDREPEDAESPASLAALWVGVVVVLVGALTVAAVLLVGLVGTTREPFTAGDVPRDSPLYLRSTVRPAHVVHLAGSGSNLAITRALAEAFQVVRPDLHVVVFDSIGSTGGVQAAYDDVIDLGLISRPLREREAALGLFTIPYARVPVVVAVNLGVPDQTITTDQLIDIYAGRHTHWSDGTPIVVLQRERGDSSHQVIDAALPEFAVVNEVAYREARWRVVDSDEAMQEALSITAGAVGLFDLGTIALQRLPVRPLRIAGIEPSEASVQSRRYPFAKELEFVCVDQPSGAAAEFLRFVDGEAGRRLMRSSGYIPLPEDQ